MRKRNGGGGNKVDDEYFYKNEVMQNKHPEPTGKEKISMRGQLCTKCNSRKGGCDCRQKIQEASFGGEHAEQYNALKQAIRDCGIDNAEANGEEITEYSHYPYLQEIPITSLTVELVNKLHEYGYHITKK